MKTLFLCSYFTEVRPFFEKCAEQYELEKESSFYSHCWKCRRVHGLY